MQLGQSTTDRGYYKAAAAAAASSAGRVIQQPLRQTRVEDYSQSRLNAAAGAVASASAMNKSEQCMLSTIGSKKSAADRCQSEHTPQRLTKEDHQNIYEQQQSASSSAWGNPLNISFPGHGGIYTSAASQHPRQGVSPFTNLSSLRGSANIYTQIQQISSPPPPPHRLFVDSVKCFDVNFCEKEARSSGKVEEPSSSAPSPLQQHEIARLLSEKGEMEASLKELKSRLETQQKEHAREIAQLKTNMLNSVVQSEEDEEEEEEEEERDDHDKEESSQKRYFTHYKKTSDEDLQCLVESFDRDKDYSLGLKRTLTDEEETKKEEQQPQLPPQYFDQTHSRDLFTKNIKNDQDRQLQQATAAAAAAAEEVTTKIQTTVTPFADTTSLSASQDYWQSKPQRQPLLHSHQGITSGPPSEKRQTPIVGQSLNSRQLESGLKQLKVENDELQTELSRIRETLQYVCGSETQFNQRNEVLNQLLSKTRGEYENRLEEGQRRVEHLESEMKKVTSLNRTLQKEVLRMQEEKTLHNRTSTVLDEKTLENLFDSEISSENDDDEDFDGYGDRDSKHIRRHRNEILDSMAHNEKVFNNIVYLKSKNRRLIESLAEWKRQYWMLEKSIHTQVPAQTTITETPTNRNNHTPAPAVATAAAATHPAESNQLTAAQQQPTTFEFNFSKYFQSRKSKDGNEEQQSGSQQINLNTSQLNRSVRASNNGLNPQDEDEQEEEGEEEEQLQVHQMKEGSSGGGIVDGQMKVDEQQIQSQVNNQQGKIQDKREQVRLLQHHKRTRGGGLGLGLGFGGPILQKPMLYQQQSPQHSSQKAKAVVTTTSSSSAQGIMKTPVSSNAGKSYAATFFKHTLSPTVVSSSSSSSKTVQSSTNNYNNSNLGSHGNSSHSHTHLLNPMTNRHSDFIKYKIATPTSARGNVSAQNTSILSATPHLLQSARFATLNSTTSEKSVSAGSPKSYLKESISVNNNHTPTTHAGVLYATTTNSIGLGKGYGGSGGGGGIGGTGAAGGAGAGYSMGFFLSASNKSKSTRDLNERSVGGQSSQQQFISQPLQQQQQQQQQQLMQIGEVSGFPQQKSMQHMSLSSLEADGSHYIGGCGTGAGASVVAGGKRMPTQRDYEGKSPLASPSGKQMYPKGIEAVYTQSSVYQKTKFTQRIKDKYS